MSPKSHSVANAHPYENNMHTYASVHTDTHKNTSRSNFKIIHELNYLQYTSSPPFQITEHFGVKASQDSLAYCTLG